MEIIPGEEIVQGVVALALSHDIVYPGPLHSLVVEEPEEQVDIIDVQIQHHQFHQHIVGDVLYGVVVVAPQAMLLLQLLHEMWPDICNFSLHSSCKGTEKT